MQDEKERPAPEEGDPEVESEFTEDDCCGECKDPQGCVNNGGCAIDEA